MGLATWEGSSPRGRKTLSSNLRCLAEVMGMTKARGVKPDRKSGVESLRRLVPVLQNLPATPAAKLAPTVSACPFRWIPSARLERGGPDDWASQVLHIIAQACALERSL